MQASQIYTIGLDVDDKSFHGFSISVTTGEVTDFRSAPNMTALKVQLSKFGTEPKNIKICYEATYLGFSLCRQLRKAGYQCDVIAPSLIPVRPGDKVQTDRRDAENLARYYLANMLTIVNVPDQEQEMDRDLLRSRKFMAEQLSALKKHINAITRRFGWDYKTEKGKKSSWTRDYLNWLREKIKTTEHGTLRINFEMLLRQYQNTLNTIAEFDGEIERLSEKPGYKPIVKALGCYRGIDRLTAMVLLSELGDIRRFSHPKQLTSYAGLDIIEGSSGGKEIKFRISKDGNRFIRTAVVEACQRSHMPIVVSKSLKIRRTGVDPKYIDIGDRCMRRLNQKSRKLLAKGKLHNKVKVACAREMLCFIWETMQAVAKSA